MLSLGLWFLLFLLLSKSESRWILEVRLHHYINPTSLTRSRLCCDSDGVLDAQCDDPCDNAFLFCLRPSVSSSDCSYGIYWTGLVTGGDDLTFTDGGLIGQNAVSNPLIFNGTQWPDNDELYFLTSVNDVDDGLIHFIDSFGTTLSYSTVSNGFSNIMTLRGTVITGISLQVSYNMRCDQDYYGSRCDVFCQSRDDNTGHYTCDSQGNQICNTGYRMNETNCTTPICDDSVCNSNQRCVSPNSCVCRDGWIGPTCDQCIINCTSTVTRTANSVTLLTVVDLLATISPVVYSSSSSAVIIDDSTIANSTSSKTTEAMIIGVVVGLTALLVMLATVAVLVVTLHKRRSKRITQGIKQNTIPMDNPNYSASNGVIGYSADYYLVTNDNQDKPDSRNGGLMRKLDNPLYEQPPPLESGDMDTQINHYSLASPLPDDDDNIDQAIPESSDVHYFEPTQIGSHYYSEGVYSYSSGPPEGVYSEIPEDEEVYSQINKQAKRTPQAATGIYAFATNDEDQPVNEGHYEFETHFK